jgi:hypothetical protein
LAKGIERIQPGNPQQNGRHERMHLTLKKEATKPPAKNLWLSWTDYSALRASPCGSPYRAIAAAARRRRTVLLSVGGSNWYR